MTIICRLIMTDWGRDLDQLGYIFSQRRSRWNPNFNIAPTTPNLQQVARRYRMATPTELSVRELVELYEDGQMAYPELVSALASHQFAPKCEAANWGEVYQRAEEMPDDNSFFWVEQAEFKDVLTEDEVEVIADAIDQYQGTP
jgi:hypothetical protein